MVNKETPITTPIFSFNDFNTYEISDLNISVPKVNDSILTTTYEVSLYIISKELLYTVNKRYTEFAGLFDTITMRYKNFNFPEFPSKLQLFNKVETRKKYFDTFIRTVLHIGHNHKEIKKDIIKILYEFLFPNNDLRLELFRKTRRSSFDNYCQDRTDETFSLMEVSKPPTNQINQIMEIFNSNIEESKGILKF